MPTLSRAPKQLNFSRDPIYVDITTQRVTGPHGAYEFTEPNLYCFLQVIKKGTPDDTIISNHRIPYQRTTAVADIDLTDLFNLKAPLPDKTSLGALTFRSGTNNASYAQFTFNYADAFGSPPVVPTTRIVGGQYSVIRGESAFWFGFGPDRDLEDYYLLHSWTSYAIEGIYGTGSSFYKEVLADQPEYLYIYSDADRDIPITTLFTRDDGTTGSHAVATLAAKKGINWISATPRHVLPASELENVKAYTIRIKNFSPMHEVSYVIYRHDPDYQMYFLYENGIGGMEVLRASGRSTKSHQVTKDIFESTRWKGSNFADGLSSSYTHRGKPTLKINTGYYSREYIDHLQQLLYTDLWLIDQAFNDFFKYVVTSSKIEVSNDDDDLYSLSLDIERSWKAGTHNTFNL